MNSVRLFHTQFLSQLFIYWDNAAQHWLSKLLNDKDFLSMMWDCPPGHSEVVLLTLNIASHDFIFLNPTKI